MSRISNRATHANFKHDGQNNNQFLFVLRNMIRFMSHFRFIKPPNMPGTFSKINIQIVFAVKFRQCLIHPSWEAELYKYITGIVTNKGQKMLAINGMPDHIHILIGMRPSCCLSDLVREIKKASNEFVNGQGYSNVKFQWQEGFGAFSYSENDLHRVIKYVLNQKEHHKKKSFREEYKAFLEDFNIEHQDGYLFEWMPD